MRMPRLCLVGLLVTACVPPGPLPPNQAHLAAPGIVVTDSAAVRLADVCLSRAPGQPPDALEGLWTPTEAQIGVLERRLALWLQDLRYKRPGNGPDRPLARYQGYYAGIVRQHRNLVCGGFWDVKQSVGGLLMDRGLPAFWFDAGWAFFRIVYDPADSGFSGMRSSGRVCVGPACEGWWREWHPPDNPPGVPSPPN